ncbi:T-complex protein 1 subunit gamma [Thoreauomyces humboldtii]|nr:T-complex protein 1 subunit gamma [Thoreauomyces humboldtii]
MVCNSQFDAYYCHSDLAQHFLMKENITAIRRARKTDNHRIARATGATIVNRVEDLKDADVGTGCGLFEVRKIGDEYFTFLEKCEDPKACTIILRGPSKDVLQEVDRNLQDAMSVARNVMFEPRLCPGGGATEMALAVRLAEQAKTISGVEQWPYKAVAEALEVIPRTLVQNCGGNAIKTLTQLRAKHVDHANFSWGIDGESGKIVDMHKYGVWEPHAVKAQTIKTAIESACLLLRVDDIVSGLSRKEAGGGGGAPNMQDGPPDVCICEYLPHLGTSLCPPRMILICLLFFLRMAPSVKLFRSSILDHVQVPVFDGVHAPPVSCI